MATLIKNFINGVKDFRINSFFQNTCHYFNQHFQDLFRHKINLFAH